MRRVPSSSLVVVALALAACGDAGTGAGPVQPLCTAPTAVTLAPGDFQLFDATQVACVRLPGAAAASEYLVVAYSGNGTESNGGSTAAYALQADPASALAELNAPGSGLSLADLPASAPFVRQGELDFHRRLRAREHALAASPAARLFDGAAAPPQAAVPVFGDKDTFSACKTVACSSFVQVTATVRFVGRSGIIYLDDQLPAGADNLTQADLDQLGALFDDYLYPADTVAFGRESDINGDGHVAILITDAVNDLTPDCGQGRVIGYFFGNDLENAQGSNHREIFYAFAPKPATSGCTAVTRARTLASLPPTLIHEFQHMISYNQHVILRGGFDEDLWLNEGMSHFAEELGARVVPDALCPASASCFSQFMSGNLSNAYDYLDDPPGNFLIAPRSGTGTLAERGAAWLFLRWAADHFSATELGTSFTRALEQTASFGSANVENATGQSFATLVGQWQLANYAEGLPGFPANGLLAYTTWDLRGIYDRNSPAVFPKPYPLTPDSTATSFSASGTLRGGSGKHVRFKLPAGSSGTTVRLAGSTSGTHVSTTIVPRVAVVRIK